MYIYTYAFGCSLHSSRTYIYVFGCWEPILTVFQTATPGRIYAPVVVRKKHLWSWRWPLKDVYICPWCLKGLFSALTIIEKIYNVNQKCYALDKLKKTWKKHILTKPKQSHTPFKFKRLEKIKSEEPFIPTKKPITEWVKLERQKSGTETKILTLNKLLTRNLIF